MPIYQNPHKIDSCIKCPYCDYADDEIHQDILSEGSDNECGSCEKVFKIEPFVQYFIYKDCALNKEEHDFQEDKSGFAIYKFKCIKCGSQKDN